MSHLYSVYRHPSKGSWGYTEVLAGVVHTALVSGDGEVTVGKIEPVKLGPELQRRVRGGFSRVAQPKYLHRTERDGKLVAEFVSQHPDLGSELGGECVMFIAIAPGTSMEEVVSEWRQRLEGCEDAPWRGNWLGHCARVTCYVPVLDTDVAAALVATQWAHDSKFVLVANGSAAPIAAPSTDRHQWRAYLAQWFPLPKIDRALDDLGWSLAGGLVPHNTDTAAIVSLTTPAGESNWFQSAQQISF